MSGASDVALLERWAYQRDAEAFAELVARHSPMVYAACNRLLRNEAHAREVAQECFVALLQETPHRLQERSSLAGWLHTVATRSAINRLRSNRRRQAREEQATETRTGNCGDARPDLDLDDVQGYVDEAIGQLPDDLREPVVAHFLEGRSHQAIAEVRNTLQKRGIAITTSVLASSLTIESAQRALASLTASLGRLALTASLVPAQCMWPTSTLCSAMPQ